jgi:hypothetical protein
VLQPRGHCLDDFADILGTPERTDVKTLSFFEFGERLCGATPKVGPIGCDAPTALAMWG